ncbi:MAG: efflux RND transporter periplasmic adaptor subunit [Parafilimonas sp.]
MKKLIYITAVTAMVLLASCGAKTDETKTTTSGKTNNAVAEKQAKLEELKKQQQKLSEEIVSLQQEIIKLDPSLKPEKAKLVAITPVALQNFAHYIDLQGKIDADDVAYVTARNGGGQVKAVYVKQGQSVGKGQLLLKLDDAVIKTQIEQAKTQLSFAQNLYNRRNNLWKENIGTEVELISAKNNVDQAQHQLNLLEEQRGFSNVYADMSGIADEVTVRVGEFFSGNPLLGGSIKIVNTSNLKVTVQVPENYISHIKNGGSMQVTLPDINKTFAARITSAGKLIDPNSRSFWVEAKLPASKDLKPNQVALVKILDYSANNTVTIPLSTLQKDEKGGFVMVASTENGKIYARKKTVVYGELYGDKLEIKSGLQEGDMLITEGFQNLYDGQLITTEA